MVRDEIAAGFAIDPAKLHVIPTGVDGGRFHPRHRPRGREVRTRLGMQDGELVAAFVGSGFERKGLRAAIEAVAQAPAWRLIVAGADRHARRYAALAARRGAGGRVHLLGAVPDVVPVLAAADAFVQPTLYDPLPNAALEALAAGVPTVTSPKSGAAELVSAAGAGFVVDALDVAGLAARLRELADPGLRERMSAAARRSVEPFTPQRTVDDLMALYEKLLVQT
jgi:UDP-glucose:(heptosyl)LPS alpha-1,3-glucosyltransferase